jgi:CubicO group peptidase (beta-lactamase class C family)
MISHDQLQERLEQLTAELHVPGAAFALAEGDDLVVASTGTANVLTGARVVPQTLFAAGSVTKVFNVTLAMTLVDDGLVELDAPVRTYLPDFALAGPEAPQDVTVRMLLNHTSGLPGNFTYDVPRGPDCVKQFVELLPRYQFNSPPGALWSYSNAGMVVTGRIAEVVTGLTWDEALARRVLRPLDLHATTYLDELVLDFTAVGHIADLATGAVERVPKFQLGTNGPSGSSLQTDIASVVEFGRMHLADGVGSNGTRILSTESAQAMRRDSAAVPPGLGVDAWGLGWSIRRAPGATLYGHTGASAGQHSLLTIIPERRAVLAALTNSTMGAALYSRLAAELLQETFGIGPPSPVSGEPLTEGVDLSPYVGRYTGDDGGVVITAADGGLHVEHEFDPDFVDTMRLIYAGAFPPAPLELTPVGGDRFLSDGMFPVQFIAGDHRDGMEFVYVGRVFRRR